ncbi:MAG: hypothetical protein K2X03_15210 [Bryobacteraceae bacterium]|nr:hypothetical protein [Bryobacteraceae bacterium]
MKKYQFLLSLALCALLIVGPAAAQAPADVPAKEEPVKEEKAKSPRPLKNTIAVILAGAAAGAGLGAGISKNREKGAIFGAIAGGIAAVIYDRVTKNDPPGKI